MAGRGEGLERKTGESRVQLRFQWRQRKRIFVGCNKLHQRRETGRGEMERTKRRKSAGHLCDHYYPGTLNPCHS